MLRRVQAPTFDASVGLSPLLGRYTSRLGGDYIFGTLGFTVAPRSRTPGFGLGLIKARPWLGQHSV